jgi:hypothetical protein
MHVLAHTVAKIPAVPRNWSPGGHVEHFGSAGLPTQVVPKGSTLLDELKLITDDTFTAI